MKSPFSLPLTAVLGVLVVPASRAAEFPNVAVPSTAATTSNNTNSIELRPNGVLIAKSPWGAPTATLLPSDSWEIGLLWHPTKRAFRAGLCSSMGQYVDSIGTDSFAAGYGAYSPRNNSAAFGWGYANGETSLAANSAYAEGDDSAAFNWASATGWHSFAVNDSSAQGAFSAAFNDGTAIGFFSAAFGNNTVAQGVNQTVVGMHNILQGNPNPEAEPSPSDALFIVGNGDPGTQATNWQAVRSNALTVRKNGSVQVQGVITCAPGGNIPMFGQ